jgi:uncharacterized protein YndB with AHSA1/START domain
MAHPFEIKDEVTVDATPEQVWDAITTGPQVDSWFMGRNEIEPRQGGAVRTDVGDFAMESTVTACEPPKRFAHQSGEGPDGVSMAFEWQIEGRDGGRTVLRFVHSGFLGGEDWEAEYDALSKGDPMYLHKLAQYLTYFGGRIAARNIFAPSLQVADGPRVWSKIKDSLALSGTVALGDRVRATLDGLPPIDGVLDYATPEFVGVRNSDGLYRFIHGHDGSVVVEHHIFAEDKAQTESVEAWQAWLSRMFA